jgi:hypothetical protein
MIEELDRINKMGFIVTLDWNMCVTINYPFYHTNSNFGHDCNVLVCQYDDFITNISFSEVIIMSCDIFYEWYNKYKTILDDMVDPIGFSDISLGNITKRVYRDLKLDKLL